MKHLVKISIVVSFLLFACKAIAQVKKNYSFPSDSLVGNISGAIKDSITGSPIANARVYVIADQKLKGVSISFSIGFIDSLIHRTDLLTKTGESKTDGGFLLNAIPTPYPFKYYMVIIVAKNYSPFILDSARVFPGASMSLEINALLIGQTQNVIYFNRKNRKAPYIYHDEKQIELKNFYEKGLKSVSGLQYSVFATREGLVGYTTANGHVIVSNDHFVSLPSFKSLCSNGGYEYEVTINYNGKSITAPVWDVGPWNTKDDYWDPSSSREMWADLSQGLPEAQAAYENGYNNGKDQFGRTVSNPAGIDLADGTFWNDLGLVNNSWVSVNYLFTSTSSYLPAPTLYAPVSNSTNQLLQPNFSWSSVTGAASYRIMVATNSADLPTDPTASTAGSSVVINDTPTGTTYTPSTPLNPGVKYYWEVHARSASYYGTWSSIYSFATEQIMMTVDPSSQLDFGSVAVGQSKTMPLTITNSASSTANLVVGSSPPSSPFQLINGSSLNLPPGSSYTLNFTFTPASAQSYTQNWSFTHNATNYSSPWTIVLKGNGTSAQINVTVQTSPAGRSFSVDGTAYTSAQTLSWTSGSSHAVATTSPQSGTSGTQYVWSSWSDGGSMSHSVVPTSNTTFIANFTTQYFLTLIPGAGGAVSPANSWYNSGQSVQVTAIPYTGEQFAGWTGSGAGSYSGMNNPATITMNGPITETAAFTPVSTAGVLSVSPADGLSSSGPQGGGFSPPSKTYTLTNTGGSSINWSASKSQSWISLSSTSGTLSTGSNTTVTVSINNNANSLSAGTYSDNISFSNTTNGNGNTSRGVTLSVSSSQTRPSWYYTITGISHVILIPMSSDPSIDGVPLSNGDYIGVFYDSLGTPACGGYVIWNGSSNVSLTAWGNDQSASNPDGFASGETFKWKIWRATDQRTFDATATYSTSASFTNTDKFAANGLSGLTNLTATSVAQQQITLNLGWQIISSYISPSNPSLDSLFQKVRSNVVIVKDGAGHVYWPAYNINSIGSWQSSQGYQIKMQSSQVLDVIGSQITPQSTPISVPKGWSIIGYLKTLPMSIDTALNGISTKIIIVKNGQGQVYWPAYGINSIGDMNPGEGYQIKLSDSATFVYPADIGSTSALRKIASSYELSPSHHFGVPEVTDNSAVILFPAKVVGDVLQPGDELGIFDGNGLLCGSGVYEGKNLAITVFGDDNLSKDKDGFLPGRQFLVKIYSRRLATEFNYVKVRYLNSDDTYQVNGINIVSSLNVDSYKFKGNAELEVLSNYPNPFNPTTTIAYNLQKTEPIRISLYNILGQLVSTLVSGVQSEGVHRLEINGAQLSSGVYEVVFQTGSTYKTIKIELIK